MDIKTAKSVYRTMFKEFPDIVTVKDVCVMLGVGRRMVYRLIADKRLSPISCGRAIKFAKLTVIDYVLQSAQKESDSSV